MSVFVSSGSDGIFIFVEPAGKPEPNVPEVVERSEAVLAAEPVAPSIGCLNVNGRYYGVRSVSARARLLCPLKVGVYCCSWRSCLEQLLPDRKLNGSGVSLRGFDSVDAAVQWVSTEAKIVADRVEVFDVDWCEGVRDGVRRF